MNFEPRRSQDDATADEEQNKYAAQFLQHGGVEVIYSNYHSIVKRLIQPFIPHTSLFGTRINVDLQERERFTIDIN